MMDELKKLLRRCRDRIMTDEECALQRISWAYGQVNACDGVDSPERISREAVEQLAKDTERTILEE